jgi:tetratricopeptide (TPR) repeat protein
MMLTRWPKKEEKPVRFGRAAAISRALNAMVSTWRCWLPQALVIIVTGIWIFLPALRGGWIWDDERYIAENHLVQDPQGFWKVWIHRGGLGDYCPLTSFVQWMQWHLWGADTFGYHLTNVGLHFTSAFLLWRLLARLGLPLAWLGGLLFTVHPPHDRIGGVDHRAQEHVVATPASSGDARLAGLGKWRRAPVLLPGSWLLCGRHAREDLRHDAAGHFSRPRLVVARENHRSRSQSHAPLFRRGADGGVDHAFAAVGSGRVGWSANHLASRIGPGDGRVDDSLSPREMSFPFWLLPSYPDLTVTSPSLIDFLPWLALAVLLGLLWAHRTNWSRHILFGLGFFLVNLVPVLGYTFIAYTHMVWSMDHLLYLPVIGWIALAVAGLGYLNSRISSLWRAIGTVPVAAGVMLMAWSGHVYAGWFASPELFWSNLLRRDPGSWLSDLNLASVYLRQHRYPEALAYSRETVRLAPDDSDGHYDLGLALEKSSQVEEAENEYRKAIQLDPKNSKALTSLGDIMRKAGRLAEAEDLFRQGLKAAPDDGALCIDLGGLLLQSGQSLEGIALYEHALELNPDLPQLQYDLGVALLRTGNPAEGVEHLEAAVRLDPKLAVAHETPRRRPGPIGPGARGDRAISGRDSARSAIRHREGQPRLCAGADGPHSGSHRTIPACAADQSGGREGA